MQTCATLDILQLIKCTKQTYPFWLFLLELKWKQPTWQLNLLMPFCYGVIQRIEAEPGRVWNAINILMALSGLLSRTAEGDGMQPSAMKSSTWVEDWGVHISLLTTRPPIIFFLSGLQCVYLWILLCLTYCVYLTLWLQAWMSRYTLQQDASQLGCYCRVEMKWKWMP